jgi:hypothetical protein
MQPSRHRTTEKDRVFHRPYRKAVVWSSIGFTVFFWAMAVFGFLKGYAPFGGHSPVACAVFAAASAAAAISGRGQGLYVEDAGVRLVRPFRPRALTVVWHDIVKFGLRIDRGIAPVNLIRASDQRVIAVPTFPRPRNAIDPGINPRYAGLRAKVEAQVDDLNALLDEHHPDTVTVAPAVPVPS